MSARGDRLSNQPTNLLNSCTNFVQRTFSHAFAHPCLLCGAATRPHLLCPDCHADLPPLPAECCPRCGLASTGGALCGACQRQPPAFDATLAARAYGFPLDALVRHCKYAGAPAVTALFAQLLAERITAGAARPEVDLMLPMPLHPRRLAERGFNQAAEICRRLAPALGVAWSADALHRTRDTPPQAGLDLQARRKNLRGAFHVTRALAGLHVALVDDVMTSGASLDELATAAKRAGAARVSCWVTARTL